MPGETLGLCHSVGGSRSSASTCPSPPRPRRRKRSPRTRTTWSTSTPASGVSTGPGEDLTSGLVHEIRSRARAHRGRVPPHRRGGRGPLGDSARHLGPSRDPRLLPCHSTRNPPDAPGGSPSQLGTQLTARDNRAVVAAGRSARVPCADGPRHATPSVSLAGGRIQQRRVWQAPAGATAVRREERKCKG